MKQTPQITMEKRKEDQEYPLALLLTYSTCITYRNTCVRCFGVFLCTIIIALVAAILLQKYAGLHFDIITLVIWSILISIIAQFGDLCMSVVKRIA